MKNLMNLKHVIFLFVLVSGGALLHSCAVYSPEVKPVTLPDIVQMSNDSLSSKYIINEIRKSHTAYTLKASEYTKLQQQGVSDSVVNFMLKTHINLIRKNYQMMDSYYWYPGYPGYWYGGFGWPYRYWGWNMRSPVFIRSDGGNNPRESTRRGTHNRK
jgi:hypothetical protein